jgi:hypothetical protein
MQKIEFRSSPSADIIIEPFDWARFPTFLSEFPEETSPLEPVSFVLTNKASRKIFGVAIRWMVVDAAGRERRVSLRSDSFMGYRQDPVAGPHAGILISPGAITPEVPVGPPFLGSGRSSSSGHAEMIGKAAAVTVELDCVIFEDGEFIGHNSVGFDSEITARYEAAMKVAKLVREALAQGKTVASALNPVITEWQWKSDNLSEWMRRYAEDVMNSHDYENMASGLERMRKPPEFFRRGSSSALDEN